MWISTFSCGIHLKIHEFCREKMSQCCGNNNNIDNGLKENRNHMAFVTRCEKYKSFLFWAFYLKYFSKTTRGDGVTAPAVARPPLPPPPCRGAAGGSSGGPAAPRATPATGAQAPAAPAAAGHRGRPTPRWGRGRVGPGTPTPPPPREAVTWQVSEHKPAVATSPVGQGEEVNPEEPGNIVDANKS